MLESIRGYFSQERMEGVSHLYHNAVGHVRQQYRQWVCPAPVCSYNSAVPGGPACSSSSAASSTPARASNRKPSSPLIKGGNSGRVFAGGNLLWNLMRA